MDPTRIIGIDFGTHKTLVSRWDDASASPRLVQLRPDAGGADMPTAVHVNPAGRLSFGDEAERQGVEDAEGLKDHFKRDLCSEAAPYLLHSHVYSVADLTREYLAWLKARVEKDTLGGEVEHAVLTVPATWLPAARSALETAATAAGFTSVEILDEPVAAGLAFLRNHQDLWQEGAVLVFDWGAGTLDLAVLNLQDGQPQVITSLVGGKGSLGGQDIDFHLLQAVNKKLAVLKLRKLERRNPEEIEHVRRRVREWKVQLAERSDGVWRMDGLSDVPPEVELAWTRQELEERINEKIVEAVDVCGQLIEKAYAEGIAPMGILLVGGSSQFPAVRDMLQKRFPDVAVLPWEHCRSAVSLGAAWHAAGQIAQPAANTELGIRQYAMADQNPLGMKFVRVGISKGRARLRSVYFGEFPVRVKDYEQFARETKRTVTKAEFAQTADDPVVNVNWHDAKAFCDWLTLQSRDRGIRFRLPTDHEWSCAAGIGEMEDASGTPKSKGEDRRAKGAYPWGAGWPPPSGNYCREESFPSTDLADGLAASHEDSMKFLDRSMGSAADYALVVPMFLFGGVIVTSFFGSCAVSNAKAALEHGFLQRLQFWRDDSDRIAKHDAAMSWANFWFGLRSLALFVLVALLVAYVVLLIKHFRYSPARVKPGIPGYGSTHPHTSPVGSYQATESGLHDLGGNVWEWTQDAWPEGHEEKVLRGASWQEYVPERLASSFREHRPDSTREGDVGFRVIMETASRDQLAKVEQAMVTIEAPSPGVSMATTPTPKAQKRRAQKWV